jgi:hypothetical protein
MTALALWVALSPVLGCFIGRCIGAGMVDRRHRAKESA